MPLARAWDWITRRSKFVRRTRYLLGMAVAGLIVFSALAVVVRGAGGGSVDREITGQIQRLDHPLMTRAMLAVSAFGWRPWNYVALVATIGGFGLIGMRREALFLIGTLGATALTALVKLAVLRPRPTEPDVRIERIVGELLDTSYPSGHVVSYVTLFGFTYFLVYALFRRSWWRTLVLTVLGALVGLVGLSRVYLGHHWASDVLGGYAFGTAYLIVLIQLYRRRARPPTQAV